jgi:hypothetical protein
MALEGTEAYEMSEAGYLRIDLDDSSWVAVMSEDNVNFGGTLWQRADDGYDYSAGCTAGYPVLGRHEDADAIARRLADFILMENGEEGRFVRPE